MMDAATGMLARLTRLVTFINSSSDPMMLVATNSQRLHNNDTDAWFRSQELQLGLLKSQLKKMQVVVILVASCNPFVPRQQPRR